MSPDIDVLISEVGPRDGLQNTKAVMPTEYKKSRVSAAAEAGVTTFESSLGGLVGCPFAAGATGNIITEEFMLEAMRLRTGINIDKLLAIRKIVAKGIPREPLYGYVPDARVTNCFVAASALQ